MDYEFVDRLIRQHEEGFDHAHRLLGSVRLSSLGANGRGAVTAIDRPGRKGSTVGEARYPSHHQPDRQSRSFELLIVNNLVPPRVRAKLKRHLLDAVNQRGLIRGYRIEFRR